MQRLKYLLPIIVLLLSNANLSGQSYLIGNGGFNFGFLQSASFQEGVLANKTPVTSGVGLGLEYRFRNLFSVEGSINQKTDNLRLQDPLFEETYTAHSLIYNQRSSYLDYSTSLQFYIPISFHSSIYLTGSYTGYFDKAEEVEKQYDYEILKADVQNTVMARATFNHRNAGFVPEIGFQTRLGSGLFVSAGMSYDFNQNNLVSGYYNLSDTRSGELLRSDEFSSNGNKFSFNIKVGVPIHEFLKREPKEIEQDPIVPKDSSDKVIVLEKKKDKDTTPIAKVEKNKKGEPVSLNNREIIKTKTVHVKADSIVLKIWDNGAQIDGDSISLNLNGEWLLTNYRLKRKQLVITVPLERRTDNYLVLYALNLGTAPPNTAAVIVYDGNNQKILRLVSDMKTCGAINIVNK